MEARNSSFEILRLVAMFIIICHHFVVHGIYPFAPPHFYDIHNFSMVVCVLLFGWGGYLGNSIFVLLTGYFSIDRQVNWKRLLLLAMTMIFYAAVVAVIWKFNGWNVPHRKAILLPFFYGYNWFVACYLIFMLFVPFLNAAILKTSSVQHLALIILLFFVNIIVPALKGANFMNDAPLFQFLLFYLIGAYLKRFKFHHAVLNKQLTYIKASIVLLIMQIAMIAYTWIFQNDIWRYVNLFSACLAVTYFMIAKTNGTCCFLTVNKLAASVLGVYLIHDNELVRSYIWTNIFPNVFYLNTPYFVLFLLVKVCCVYFVCLLIDQVRVNFIEVRVKKLLLYIGDKWTSRAVVVKRKMVVFMRDL